MLGAKFSKEEQESVLAVWRYAGYLMGIPETILYRNGAEAEKIYKVGYLVRAEGGRRFGSRGQFVDSSPFQRWRTSRTRLSKSNWWNWPTACHAPSLERSLADSFEFPPDPKFATLFKYRIKQRVLRLVRTNKMVRSDNFTQLLQISVYDSEGLSYKMPDHVYTSKSNPW